MASGNGKLRQWLIEQVDTGKYPGLVWENDEKSIFRIPWKHAGKQDYNREEDAALFKVDEIMIIRVHTIAVAQLEDLYFTCTLFGTAGLGCFQGQVSGRH